MAPRGRQIPIEEDHPATEMCSIVSRRMEDAATRLQDFHLESEGRFNRIEVTLQTVAENLKTTSEAVQGLNKKDTDFATELATLKTQMNVVKYVGGAVALGVIGLLLETFHSVLTSPAVN